MAKNTAVLFLLTAILLVEFASESTALTFNPQIGVNASALDNDPVDSEFKTGKGWQVGVYLRLDTSRFYLQPGLFWHVINTELETTDQITQETSTFENSVYSIRFPLVIGANVIDGEIFDLRLQFGTAVDFITNVDDNNHFTRGDLNSSYISLVFAVGIDIALFTVDLGYDLGVTDYFTVRYGDTSGKMHGWFLNL